MRTASAMLEPNKVEAPADAPMTPADAAAWEATEVFRMAEPAVGERPVFPEIPALRLPQGAAVWRRHAVSLALWTISIGALLAFWYLGTKYRWDIYMRFTNIPTPAEVLHKVAEVSQSGKFLTNVLISVRRIFTGFTIATLIGVPLGLAIGRFRLARDLLLPMFEVLRPIPAIAWVPMSIMLWPTNEVSIVFITFLGSFFPILLNTIHGVKSLDKVLLRAGSSLGADEPRLFVHVILPGAMPQIFTGLTVGMGVAWVSLIAAEMISGQFGVGYFTWEAYSLIAYSEIVLGMITIGILGLVSSGMIRLAGNLTMPWLAYSDAGKR